MVDRGDDDELSPDSDTLPDTAPFGLRVATRKETANARIQQAELVQHLTRGMLLK